MNFHYENMLQRPDSLQIPATSLHYDDGVTDLDPDPIFDWREIYGHGPEVAAPDSQSVPPQ